GELEVLVEVGLVDVDRCGLRLGTTGLELLERVLAQLVGLAPPWGVVVGGHGVPLLRGFSRASCPRSSDGGGRARRHGRPPEGDRRSGAGSPSLGPRRVLLSGPAPCPSAVEGRSVAEPAAPQRREGPVCARRWIAHTCGPGRAVRGGERQRLPCRRVDSLGC